MFRIFLKKKLFSGDLSKLNPEQSHLAKAKNRRTDQRFSVDQQHLTVMNDQDILVIRDISTKGFCSDVSLRAYDRFELNDVFAARMRYHGGVEEIQVKVAWKREQMVGFELYLPDEAMRSFIRNLIRPIELASSLVAVEAAFMRDQHPGLVWFHGDDIDLHIWVNEEHELVAWQLVADGQVIEWSSASGIKTGSIKAKPELEPNILEPGETMRVIDLLADPVKIRMAIDIFTALPFPERNELLKSLDDEMTNTEQAN